LATSRFGEPDRTATRKRAKSACRRAATCVRTRARTSRRSSSTAAG